ncbi:hypothetical protein CES85_3639 (plasmid) [Ochrobactrum quorumnocens]|uniref:Uncharacterized protein n=1 Tax=Ochrobactrum quorumnocens TaxID=271865 RepID=A0A248UNW7_9HYPH|nr:hypothetical protein CES85_3639 [[Ochrobactrum] quorumnocens]
MVSMKSSHDNRQRFFQAVPRFEASENAMAKLPSLRAGSALR